MRAFCKRSSNGATACGGGNHNQAGETFESDRRIVNNLEPQFVTSEGMRKIGGTYV